MIVYSASRQEFTRDVRHNSIADKILRAFKSKVGHGTGQSEIQSWNNSIRCMNDALELANTPDDARVAIEYMIPLTSRRVDFILTGLDEEQAKTAVIVELKQWTEVAPTEKDAIVVTYVGRGLREITHPSYQAWTYASLIRDYNVDVRRGGVQLKPCAYLHNCSDEGTIKSPFYAAHTSKAPSFLKNDAAALADFLRRYVKYGDRSSPDILYTLDHGRIRPSKSLADHLTSLLSGNREFEMIDDQKIVYETALSLAAYASEGRKQVLIVEGGPGTGKSVVAVNLLVELTRRRQVAHYITRNAAPREVYRSKLAGTFTRTRIANLFKSSGAYTDTAPNTLDAAIVDESHRLNEKSGLYQNRGENQIKEIVLASKLSVFFLDEDQRVTLKDIGNVDGIRQWAKCCGAEVTELKLESQFRCNGSDGYLAWLSHALQLHDSATDSLDEVDYDFRMCSTPNELRKLIEAKNTIANKARLVAGYCWDWKGKNDSSIKDVVIPEHDFAMPWNLSKDGSLWLVAPNSVTEVGCIHTCQGLELDYVGVIIGYDFVVRDGIVITDATKRSRQDRSVHGYKGMHKKDPVEARQVADRIIKNTYRTLMTRGQKGCYMYCVDPETNEYFANFAPQRIEATLQAAAEL